MNEPKTPAEWCREMQEKAKDGDEAYDYFQMQQAWEQKTK